MPAMRPGRARTERRVTVSPSRRLDTTFKVAVTLKGIDGFLEIVGGVVLLFVRPHAIDWLARTLTQHELSQDPHDFIASHILHSAGQLTHGSKTFAALYLLSHGLAKLGLVVAVLRNQLWAYPSMIALLGAFIAYQVYRLAEHLTIGLTLLTVFDAFVVWLTWREYGQKRLAQRVMSPPSTTSESPLT
jgi:uncharacterized membrane protein